MTVAVCPGSFDPPTNGHIEVVERSARHFSKVVVAVVTNPSKAAAFDAATRVEMLKEALADVKNAEVAAYDGLLVDFVKRAGARVVVKGLRAASDLEHELQMAQMNANLARETDTFFVAASPEWSFLSSSLVKEVARLGGDVSALVPETVNRRLKDRFAQGARGGEGD